MHASHLGQGLPICDELREFACNLQQFAQPILPLPALSYCAELEQMLYFLAHWNFHSFTPYPQQRF
jgi:hypothetical protein